MSNLRTSPDSHCHFATLGCPNQGFAETYSKNPKVVSDMTALHHINEPAILYNLGERAKLKNQRPYTFMVSECRGFPAVVCRSYRGEFELDVLMQ